MTKTFVTLIGYTVFCYLIAVATYETVKYIAGRQVEVYLIQPWPGEPGPSPHDVSALIEEARRITREAGQ